MTFRFMGVRIDIKLHIPQLEKISKRVSLDDVNVKAHSNESVCDQIMSHRQSKIQFSHDGRAVVRLNCGM